MSQGFIKLQRKIQDHWIYQEKRKFSKYEAWLDMLMMANHKPNKFVLGNDLIEVERGQFVTSVRKLGERWDWSNTKVSQFLDLLKADEMIVFKKDTKKTVITIINYGFYHDYENEKNTLTEHEKDTKRTQKHTNKNVKNVKNEKNNKLLFKEFVYLSEEEHQKLIEQLGQTLTNDMIDRLNNYIGSSGKKYKSHYHTILNWSRKEKPKEVKHEKRDEQPNKRPGGIQLFK